MTHDAQELLSRAEGQAQAIINAATAEARAVKVSRRRVAAAMQLCFRRCAQGNRSLNRSQRGKPGQVRRALTAMSLCSLPHHAQHGLATLPP
jgi:hypothetical protein